MATRQPFTWLVVDTAPDHAGNPTVLLARASYDAESDVITVTTPAGRHGATQVSVHPMQPLAKLMLRQMFTLDQSGAAR